MISDGVRASEVIRRIRGLLKKNAPEKEPFNINETIQDVIALSANELFKNRVSLRTTLADGLPTVFGDRIQLQQVLLNLILNANEAMSGEGWQPREMIIRSRASKLEGVVVAVQDSGKGFDQQTAAHIFDAFFTTKTNNGGLGLGLSISRTIIEAHGGRLWATPNKGKGVTFRFTLPTG
jgi:signal transduction histidine kinase